MKLEDEVAAPSNSGRVLLEMAPVVAAGGEDGTGVIRSLLFWLIVGGVALYSFWALWREREHGRFGAPYLRDSLLAAGALCETLETATNWSNIPALKAAVTAALSESLGQALVMCHISHVYPTGASLYFTVVSAQGPDPVEHWRRAKRAANDAIIAAGGTISHHHGVGTDHRDWYAAEIGPLAVDLLRAVKRRVDPVGILNPGVLLP